MKQRPSNLLLSMLRAMPAHSIINDAQLLETKLIEGLASNLIESPQKLVNSLYYRMRVTGTGDVWRESTGDTYRPEGRYINAEFIQRCIGLPLVVEHPKDGLLGTEDKVVGTTVFAYVPDNKPDEVWCIARIIDGQAQDDLLSEKLSTSPSVVTAPSEQEAEEGVPVYIDHLAIVPLGVWDHDGPPSGIDQDVMLNDAATSDNSEVAALENPTNDGALDMNPEELKKLINDCMADHMGPLHSRLDALEKKADSHEEVEGHADSQEGVVSEKEGEKESGTKEKEMSDSKKVDSKKHADSHETHNDSDEDEEVKQNTELAVLRAELEELKKAQAGNTVSDEEVSELADAQAMADSVMTKFGKRAPMPMNGERAVAYRKRMLTQLKSYSPSWKDVDLAAINDSQVIKNIETQVYADAAKAARKPVDLKKGQLREIKREIGGGRTASEFVGDCDAWMNEFKLMPRAGRFRSH